MAHLSKDTIVMLGGGEVSAIASEFTIEQTADAPETTTFGNDYRRFKSGLKAGTVTISGYIDNADKAEHMDWLEDSTSPSATDDSWGAPGEKWCLILPRGRKVGEPAIAFKVHQTSWQDGGSVGDAATFSWSGVINGDVYEGQVMLELKRNTAYSASLPDMAAVPTDIWGPVGASENPRKQLLVIGNRTQDATIDAAGVLLDAAKYTAGSATPENINLTLNDNGEALSVKSKADADNTAPYDSLQPKAHASDYTNNFRIGMRSVNAANGRNRIGSAGDNDSTLWVCVVATDYGAEDYA